MVQLSHPHWTTGKTIALTRWTFVGKVMSLLFSMLSRLVITFLLRSKHLLNSWLQSPSAVILEPKKIKSVTVSIVLQSIWHEMMATVAWIVAWRYVKWMTANHQQKWYVTKQEDYKWIARVLFEIEFLLVKMYFENFTRIWK